MSDRLVRLDRLRRLDARAAARVLRAARADAQGAAVALDRIARLLQRRAGDSACPGEPAAAQTTGALLATEARVRLALRAAYGRAAERLAHAERGLADAECASRLAQGRQETVAILSVARHASAARRDESRRLEHSPALARPLLKREATPAGARDR